MGYHNLYQVSRYGKIINIKNQIYFTARVVIVDMVGNLNVI